MKNAGLPKIAVESNLQTAVDSASQGGEAVFGVAAKSVRSDTARRDVQRELVSRALAAREEAKQTGQYVSSDEMLKRLDASLVAASVRQIG